MELGTREEDAMALSGGPALASFAPAIWTAVVGLSTAVVFTTTARPFAQRPYLDGALILALALPSSLIVLLVTRGRTGTLRYSGLVGAAVALVASWTLVLGASKQYMWNGWRDGIVFMEMGQSFSRQHVFLYDGAHPAEHYGPLYPIVLAAVYLFFPVTFVTTRWVIVGMVGLAAGTILATTWKLHGLRPALFTTTVAMTVPGLMIGASRNGAEPLLLALYTATVYCILRSMDAGRGHYMVLAGAFAGMAYLTKSSTGYLFLLAGLGGLAWRVKFAGWRGVFRDRYYLAAVAVFFAFVGAWTLRNILVFIWGRGMGLQGWLEHIDGDNYFDAAYAYALAHPVDWIIEGVIFLGLSILFFLVFAWPFLGKIRRPTWDQRGLLLFMAAALPTVLGIAVSALYFVFEKLQNGDGWAFEIQVGFFMINTTRYIFIGLVPLAWLSFSPTPSNATGAAGRP